MQDWAQKLVEAWPQIQQGVVDWFKVNGPKIWRGFRVFCLAFSGLLFISIVLILAKARTYIKESFLTAFKGSDVKEKPGKLKKQWAQVENQLEKESLDKSKMALIKADSILDNVLKKAGFAGETLAGRLKQFDKGELSNLDQVWQAHKLRNQIAHEPDKKIRYVEIKKGVQAIENALEELEGI